MKMFDKCMVATGLIRLKRQEFLLWLSGFLTEEVGSIPGLAQWVTSSGVAVRCGVGCRHGLDLALLWLWHRPAAFRKGNPQNERKHLQII